MEAFVGGYKIQFLRFVWRNASLKGNQEQLWHFVFLHLFLFEHNELFESLQHMQCSLCYDCGSHPAAHLTLLSKYGN